MGFHGVHWGFMEFHGVSLNMMDVSQNSWAFAAKKIGPFCAGSPGPVGEPPWSRAADRFENRSRSFFVDRWSLVPVYGMKFEKSES